MTTITRGISWSLSFVVYPTEIASRTNKPDDLTGWRAKAAIVGPCLSAIASLPISVSSPLVGRVTVDMTADQTSALPAIPKAFWAAVVTDPNGRDYFLQPAEPIRVIDAPTGTFSTSL